MRSEDRKRIAQIGFGDPVTNVCAGDHNPHRECFFVRVNGSNITCTDRKGVFWDTCAEVIYAGSIGIERCRELFQPIWERQYGKKGGTK